MVEGWVVVPGKNLCASVKHSFPTIGAHRRWQGGQMTPSPNLVIFLILSIASPKYLGFDPLDFQKCTWPTLKNFLAAPMFPTPSLQSLSHQLYPISMYPLPIFRLATGLQSFQNSHKPRVILSGLAILFWQVTYVRHFMRTCALAGVNHRSTVVFNAKEF